MSFSFRVEGRWLANFDGADADLNPLLVYTNRPDFRGGDFINFGYGVNTILWKKHRAALEIVQPVYQHLNGVQLETDWMLFSSWSGSW